MSDAMDVVKTKTVKIWPLCYFFPSSEKKSSSCSPPVLRDAQKDNPWPRTAMSCHLPKELSQPWPQKISVEDSLKSSCEYIGTTRSGIKWPTTSRVNAHHWDTKDSVRTKHREAQQIPQRGSLLATGSNPCSVKCNAGILCEKLEVLWPLTKVQSLPPNWDLESTLTSWYQFVHAFSASVFHIQYGRFSRFDFHSCRQNTWAKNHKSNKGAICSASMALWMHGLSDLFWLSSDLGFVPLLLSQGIQIRASWPSGKNERVFEAPSKSNRMDWMIFWRASPLKDERAALCKLRKATRCSTNQFVVWRALFQQVETSRSCSIISSWTCCFSTCHRCPHVNASEDTNAQTAIGMLQRCATTGAAHLFLQLGDTLLQFVHLVVVEPENLVLRWSWSQMQNPTPDSFVATIRHLWQLSEGPDSAFVKDTCGVFGQILQGSSIHSTHAGLAGIFFQDQTTFLNLSLGDQVPHSQLFITGCDKIWQKLLIQDISI